MARGVQYSLREPMNHALPQLTARSAALWATSDETARLRRLRSLLTLFVLYAGSLLAVAALSDGADIGCILAGIAGHVLYATCRMIASFRDATWIEEARLRCLLRHRTA